jgi:hypothetical protein
MGQQHRAATAAYFGFAPDSRRTVALQRPRRAKGDMLEGTDATKGHQLAIDGPYSGRI